MGMFTKLFNRNFDPYQIKGSWKYLYVDFENSTAGGDLEVDNISFASAAFTFSLPDGQTPLMAVITDIEFKESASGTAQLSNSPSVYSRPNGQFTISISSVATNANLVKYLVFVKQES